MSARRRRTDETATAGGPLRLLTPRDRVIAAVLAVHPHDRRLARAAVIRAVRTRRGFHRIRLQGQRRPDSHQGQSERNDEQSAAGKALHHWDLLFGFRARGRAQGNGEGSTKRSAFRRAKSLRNFERDSVALQFRVQGGSRHT